MKQRFVKSVVRLFLVFGFLFCMPFFAQADSLKLNGIASFQALNQEVYIAALYLEQPANSEEQVLQAEGEKRMEFRISRNKWYKRNYTKTWARAITINNDTETQEAMAKYIVHFSHLPGSDLLYGDNISIHHKPNIGSIIKINGVALLTIKNQEFFNTAVKAWLGKRPPSTDFKQRLLALDSNDIQTKDLLGRFKSLEPIDPKERTKTIKTWR